MDLNSDGHIYPVILSSLPSTDQTKVENPISDCSNVEFDPHIKIKDEPLSEQDFCSDKETFCTSELHSENSIFLKEEISDSEDYYNYAKESTENVENEEFPAFDGKEVGTGTHMAPDSCQGENYSTILKTEIKDETPSSNLTEDVEIDCLLTVDKEESDPESEDRTHAAASCCEVCSMDFEEQTSFTEHMFTEHSRYLCDSDSGNSDDDLDENNQSSPAIDDTESQGNTKACMYCTETFKSSESLKKHLDSAHKEEDNSSAAVNLKKNIYKCTLCNKHFRDKFNTKRHFLSRHNSVKNFQCLFEGCDRMYKQEWELRRHQRAAHSVKCADAFLCQECDQRFTSTRSLQLHLKFQHGGQHAPKYICQICQKGFHFPWRLKRHSDMVHSNKKPYTCTVADCDKAFKEKSALKRHMDYVHSENGEEKFDYICKVCWKVLKSPYSLRRHVRKCHENKS